jgi:hypothetical protein
LSDEYHFLEDEPQSDGDILIRWLKNGQTDPLNFWYVPPSNNWESTKAKVANAKERIRSGELG